VKILIGGDSRSIWPKTNSGECLGLDWVQKFASITNNAHHINAVRAECNHWLFSIFILEEGLKSVPDDWYDLIVIQAGWHEGVCYWPENVFKGITLNHFKKECLIDGRDKPNTNQKVYLYSDIEGQNKVIETCKKKAKNILFIGMHTLKNDNDLDKEYQEGTKHHYDVLKMNESFSSMDIDFLNMPMDVEWVKENGYPSGDGIHYNNEGVEFIASYLKRYVERLGKTIPDLLKDSSNNKDFFTKAMKMGAKISHLTDEGDVVVLTKPSGEELFLEFIGSILYKRKPIILQYPSSKIHSDEFDKKMEHVNQQLAPSLCLADEQHKSVYQKYFTTHSSLDNLPDDLSMPTIEATDIAFIQMSSGTTGAPKILYVTHREAIENCEEYGKNISLDKDSSVVSWLPLYHDMGLVAGFLLPLLSDAKFHIVDPFAWLSNPESFMELIKSHGATHVWMPNFAFNYMTNRVGVDDKFYDLSTVKKFISCSEPTYFEDLNNFYNKFKQFGLSDDALSVCYALAENVFAVSQSEGIKEETYEGKKYISCGKIIPGVSVLIVDEGQDVTNEKAGMVYINSSSRPKSNRDEDLYYGYYNTGDIGFMKDGHLYIIDRQKDSFVSYGVNIYPSSVEQKISQTTMIKPGRVACFGVPNRSKGTSEVHICAEFTGPDTDRKATSTAIMKKIKDIFDVSATVHLRKEGFLIKTSSGKVNRSLTREKLCL
jgi:fatty-acyl-CoA synthase